MICSGLAIIRVEAETFFADLADIIRHNIDDASGLDLILLAKGAFYLRKFGHTKDLYAQVHAKSMSKFNLRELSEQEVDIMSQLYTQHGVMSDSPFVGNRVQR